MSRINQTTPTLTVIEGRPENQPVVDDFRDAARRRGWHFASIAGINSDKIARFDLSEYPLDCVVFRNLTKNNFAESERLLQYLKKNRKIIINAEAVGGRSVTSDKHFQQGLFMSDSALKEYALPTYEAKHKANVMSYIKGNRVKFPIVLKYRYGTTGQNITLVRNEQELETIQDFTNLLIEQYVEPECDWRVFVVGGVAVGIMRKNGDPNHPEDFIAWSAGRQKFLEKDPVTIEELGRIACRAAAVSGLNYAGVDIIRDAHTKKLYVLETNYAAGWMNFIPVTNINIPDHVINWFDERMNAKSKPIADSITIYIKNRKKYLPPKIQKSYHDILNGVPGATYSFEETFATYPADNILDAGKIFSVLHQAYRSATEDSQQLPYYAEIVHQISSLPLSWAGNFIGPNVGTLEDGAILSALYLFLLHKSSKI